MKLISEQWIFVVRNYLRTRSFQKFQQLFEQGCLDRASSTEITIWKNVKKYRTERLSWNPNKCSTGRMRTDNTQDNMNLLQEKLIEDLTYQPDGMVWTLLRVHSTESLNAILNGILISCM